MRGKAISLHPKNIGISQLPKPPINTGMTTKKIITKAWEVTITLYKWSLKINDPGWLNSKRMMTLRIDP